MTELITPKYDHMTQNIDIQLYSNHISVINTSLYSWEHAHKHKALVNTLPGSGWNGKLINKLPFKKMS